MGDILEYTECFFESRRTYNFDHDIETEWETFYWEKDGTCRCIKGKHAGMIYNPISNTWSFL